MTCSHNLMQPNGRLVHVNSDNLKARWTAVVQKVTPAPNSGRLRNRKRDTQVHKSGGDF